MEIKKINPKIYVGLFVIGFFMSAINPHDYFTWMLEVFPAFVGFWVLIFTYNRFRFTNFTYSLILVHCYILFIGGHYTYAEVPIFSWIKDVFEQSRNNYDKLGHFAQGFVPAAITREIFIRRRVVRKGIWLSFLAICVCMTISAFYELIEWLAELLLAESSDAFLGTQGDVWDTQSDMLFALLGAVCMNIFLSKFQYNQIRNLRERSE